VCIGVYVWVRGGGYITPGVSLVAVHISSKQKPHQIYTTLSQKCKTLNQVRM